MNAQIVDQAKSIDLLALASRYATLKRVASSGGGEYAGPCPICKDGRDRFRVQPLAGRWLCRVCTDGAWQDAIAFEMRLTGEGFTAAVHSLAGGELPSMPAAPIQPTDVIAHEGPPPAQWQARAAHLASEAMAALWGAEGGRALAWLRGRGLADETLRRWHLGYLPVDRGEAAGQWGLEGKPIYLPRGILIPCQVSGATWYLKVRKPAGSPKYIQPRGSRPALYLADTLASQAAAVFTEGEFDALLLWQEAGDLVGVATLGSASNRLDVGTWGLYFIGLVQKLLAYDSDEAGQHGAAGLAWLGGAQRLAVPQLSQADKDLTDYHRSGGDLRKWLIGELEGTQDAPGSPTRHLPEEPGHLCPADLEVSQPPVCGQDNQAEEDWWAGVLAAHGLSNSA